jgi:hypothetical protein
MIFIHSIKYINIFLISYTKCARKFLYVLQCAANQKSLRTTALEPGSRKSEWILNKQGMMWIAFIWLSKGSSDRLS